MGNKTGSKSPPKVAAKKSAPTQDQRTKRIAQIFFTIFVVIIILSFVISLTVK